MDRRLTSETTDEHSSYPQISQITQILMETNRSVSQATNQVNNAVRITGRLRRTS
jgi:hypothetical protein